MAKKNRDLEISTSPSEIEALISRFERNELTREDRTLNVHLLRLVLRLVALLQKKNTTISLLKRCLFGPSSDRRHAPSAAQQAPDPQPDADSSNTSDASGSDASHESPTPKQATPNHGRLPASAFPGAEQVRVPHPDLHAGDSCPFCQQGRLFTMREPSIFIRREGQMAIAARRFDCERLRCSSCQQVFTAPMPEEVTRERFDPSADAVIAVNRYFAGLPFERQALLQKLQGVPLPPSVQFERCEVLANAVDPVFKRLWQLGAETAVLHVDDTRVRILSLQKEIEQEKQARAPARAERTGLYTTGMVARAAVPIKAPRIALYRSGRKHAGEHSAELLEQRPEELGPVIRVGDALPANRTGGASCTEAGCWPHARRKLIAIEKAFPRETAFVLDVIAELYRVDAECESKSPEERLAIHQAKSLPKLEELKAWIEERFESRQIEPNSSLGDALTYMLNAWKLLTEFTRTAGVPLDNNEAERSLKVVARQRKNSLFYRNEIGAAIGDVLQSVIQTCALNEVNPIAYLTEVGRNRSSVRADPEAWLPWRWAARRSAAEGEVRAG